MPRDAPTISQVFGLPEEEDSGICGNELLDSTTGKADDTM